MPICLAFLCVVRCVYVLVCKEKVVGFHSHYWADRYGIHPPPFTVNHKGGGPTGELISQHPYQALPCVNVQPISWVGGMLVTQVLETKKANTKHKLKTPLSSSLPQSSS